MAIESVGNIFGFASCQVWEAGLGHCGESGGLLYSEDHIQWWQLLHNQGQGHGYKLCWSVNDTGTTGAGVFVAIWWLGEAFEVQKVPDRIIIGKLIVGQCVVTALSVYAPQWSSDEIPYSVVATAAQSRARTPGTSSTGP